ncbi:MAG: hypothetical protein AB7U95_39455 [Reyranella sp.]
MASAAPIFSGAGKSYAPMVRGLSLFHLVNSPTISLRDCASVLSVVMV